MFKGTLELVVALLTIVSLVVVLVDIFFPLNTEEKIFIYIFDLGVVIILAIDFVFRLKKSTNKRRFIMGHWYEIPAMLPLILYASADTTTLAGQIFQQLRVIAFFRLIRLYYILTLIQGSKFVLLSAFTCITILFGALGVYLAEYVKTGANITNLSDAFWWVTQTITTVGYGDVYPITIEGRIIGTVMMFAGIGILATFITTLGAELVELRLRRIGKENKVVYGRDELSQKTKDLIKGQIDRAEVLDDKDFDTLIEMVNSLRHRYRTT